MNRASEESLVVKQPAWLFDRRSFRPRAARSSRSFARFCHSMGKLILFGLLTLACSGGDDDSKSVPPVADAPEGRAERPLPEPAPGELSPELIETFRRAEAISDTAGADLDTAIDSARVDGPRHARILRDFLTQRPDLPGVAKGVVFWALGQLGSDEDVPLLERTARAAKPRPWPPEWDVTRRASRPAEVAADTVVPNHSNEDGLVDPTDMEAAQSVSAILTLAHRGSRAARTAVDRFLAEGEPSLAQIAALSLFVHDELTAAHRAVLDKRKIPHNFRPLTVEELPPLQPEWDDDSRNRVPAPAMNESASITEVSP